MSVPARVVAFVALFWILIGGLVAVRAPRWLAHRRQVKAHQRQVSRMFGSERDLVTLGGCWRRLTREAWRFEEVQFPLTWSAGIAMGPEAVQKKVLIFYPDPLIQDRWGRDLEFRRFGDVLAIRSAGSDGRFETDVYPATELYPLDRTERDIVVINGAVVQGPLRPPDD